MSYINVTYHIVFAPKYREAVINIEHERELYKFIFNFSEARGVKVWRIGGMPDHVHMLVEIPAKMAISDYMKLIKTESSKYMRSNRNFPLWKGWGEEYACVSVDASSRQVRIDYIRNQKEHHRKVSFTEEYEDFLREYGFDPSVPIWKQGDK